MLIYQSLPTFDNYEIEGKSIDDLILLPLSMGETCPSWKKTQDICVILSNHDDERVRANSALGLAYTARTKRRLEKHIVKPVLLNLLKTTNEYQWRIIDSIEDINYYLKWTIGKNAIKK